jgi:START domain
LGRSLRADPAPSIRRRRLLVECRQIIESWLDSGTGGDGMRTRSIRWSLAQCAISLALLVSTAGAADWTLEKQAEGIDVYTRPVPGSEIKEFRGEGVVSVDSDAIVTLLRDSDRFKEWFPNTIESKLLKRDGDVSFQYSVMSTPWPISDRDNVFRSVTKRDKKTGGVEISVSAAPTEFPIQSGRHRVTKARGSWRLTPRGPDKTLVTFTMHLEPGGGLPDWLVNARVVATPFEALVNLRNILGASTAH